MASCDMQPTPSQEELKRTENNKNEKNSEESRPMHDDSDAVATSSSETELRPSRSSATRTRIPAPVFMGPSASSRVYSSVVVQRKSRTSLKSQQMADDSGINLDCSMTEVQTPLSTRPSPMEQTMLDRIPATSSEMELRLEEEQTLRELQRVVAEMEADVALHDLDMQDLQPGDDEQDTQLQNAVSDVGNGIESFGLNMTPETETLQKTLPSEPENRLVYEELPAENLQMVQEEIAQKEEFSEIKETAVEIESVKEFELFEQLAEEPVEECTEILQDTPQDAVGEESAKCVPESVMEELEMVIGGSGESEQDRLIREQIEKGTETLGPKFHQPADEIVCIDTEPEPELVAYPSLDGSMESNQGMVTLEELFDPEHNVELLRHLLQTITEQNSEADTAPDLTESEQTEEKETEAEVEMETEIEEEMDADLKQTGKPSSFLRRLMNHRILKFSYPILFCSLAFSLIYISRKE
ncbi:neurobeachin [Drosophila teissieri]|uniref:neurobeachin n=1 Tax=Drosophila teissieri TaxID=7243 RepID=UPI001CBA3C82|nr:neurobeachin [Drosophila teissieri]XP_043661891.1 neurobeachin [Drosophila teissieri]